MLLLHYSEGTCCKKFSPLVYALRCRFYCCWCCYYTTARVNAAKFFAVGVRVALPFLLLLLLLLHYGEGKRCSNFRRWCRRYDAVFTAVGAAIILWRGQMLLKFSPLVSALCYPFFAVGTDVYAVARRFFFIVLGNDYVATCSRGTAALFLPFQVLDTTHPVLPPPNSSPLRPLS